MSSTRSLAPAVALARLALGCGAALASVGAPAAGAEDPAGSPALMDSSPKVVQMTPYLVQVSVLGSIGVTFTLQGDDTEDVMAPIFWASITDVPPGGPGDRAGLKAGDELIRLNGRLIRGLTIREFSVLVRQESLRGNLIWSVRRGIMGASFTTVFNGKTRPGDRPFTLISPGPRPASRPDVPDRPLIQLAPERIEQMEPYTVEASRSVAIEVRFILSGERLAASLDDPIREANIVDAQGEGVGLRGNPQVGDALVGLNGVPLRGLTLRQLGTLVATARKQGDLVWDVRRGLATFPLRFNGRWIKPLPTP